MPCVVRNTSSEAIKPVLLSCHLALRRPDEMQFPLVSQPAAENFLSSLIISYSGLINAPVRFFLFLIIKNCSRCYAACKRIRIDKLGRRAFCGLDTDVGPYGRSSLKVTFDLLFTAHPKRTHVRLLGKTIELSLNLYRM